jgi:hypothetical protein
MALFGCAVFYRSLLGIDESISCTRRAGFVGAWKTWGRERDGSAREVWRGREARQETAGRFANILAMLKANSDDAAGDTPSARDDTAGGTPPAHEAGHAPHGNTFISDGVGLTRLQAVPWNSRTLRATVSVALADERLRGKGAFAIVHGRHAGTYTARPLGSFAEHMQVVLKVVLCDTRWLAIGPAGTEPREVFADGHSEVLTGPVPVEALA